MSEPHTYNDNKMAVADPSCWHIYPGGAHHLLTECSPSLHAMVARFLPDVIDPWAPKTESEDEHNAAYFHSGWVSALREAKLMAANGHDPLKWIESQIYPDVNLPGQPASFGCKTWDREDQSGSLTESSINEASPMTNDASPTFQSSSIDAYEPHKCARAMMIVHNDNSETMTSFDHPMAQKGWKFRNINGVPMLVIGYGVPRRHIPLTNVKFMDLLSEDEL